tara:strand:+ start:290 stop:700 length:411 start_codon:yes stop_codon:yes gene_type:complete
MRVNNHQGLWEKGNKKCLCCNKTIAELKEDYKKFNDFRKAAELTAQTRAMLLNGFYDYISIETHGNHFWYTWMGNTCRSCSGAPQTVGEMFLAVYSEGDWLCDKCYARNPQDTKGRWKFAPLPDDEEIDEDYLTMP